MARHRNELKIGVLLSYLNMALGMLIPFFYTPVMLKMLGQEEYGLFSLSSSVVSYLSLLSFGFGTTIVRYIAKYRAENDKDNLERVYGFFILLYCGMAIVVIICGILLANNVEPIFHKGLTSAEQIKMKTLVLIMTASSALSFPLSVFTSMIIAYERFVFRNIINILSTILAPIANLIALWLGYRSVGMALAGLAVHFFLFPWNIRYCRVNLQLKPSFRSLPNSLIYEMINVSFYHFLASIVEMLFWSTDKVILGMLSGSIAVAVYNIGATFHNMVVSLSGAIANVLMPKTTKMVYTETSNQELTEFFIKIGRIEFIIVALFICGYTVFGKPFITIWAGEEYSSAYVVSLLTMYPICVPLIQNIGLNIIIARNKHKFRSVLYFTIAIINVVSTYIVVPKWGIVGAAFCSGASYLIGHGIIMNLYYWKEIGIGIPKFWHEITKMALIPVTMIISGLMIQKFYLVDNWTCFFISVLVFSVIYSILMWFFVMNDYEKEIILSIVRVIKRRVKV